MENGPREVDRELGKRREVDGIRIRKLVCSLAGLYLELVSIARIAIAIAIAVVSQSNLRGQFHRALL